MRNEGPGRRLFFTMAAGMSALILAVVLMQSLSQVQVVAQQEVNATLSNLSVLKAVNASEAGPGDVLTYSVRVMNTEEPVAAWLTDEIPAEVTYIPGSLEKYGFGDAAYADGVITWTYDQFGYGHTTLITFSVQIPAGLSQANIVNTAQVTGAGQLLTSSAETEVKPGKLEAVKSAGASVVHPGEEFAYSVHISNTGGASLSAVWVTDVLPTEVVYVADSLSATVGSYGESDGVITWNVTAGPGVGVPFPPSSEAVLTFNAEVLPGAGGETVITNTAQITGAGELISVPVPVTMIDEYLYFLPFLAKRWPPIPYVPVLHDLVNPPLGTNNYTVTWSYDHADIPAVSYTLQEASSSSFSDAVEYVVYHSGTENHMAFTDKPDGTYYYRVRANNDYGSSAWSFPDVLTVFTAYHDAFTNSASGWPNQTGDIKDDQGTIHGHWYRRYKNNDYQIYIEDSTCWTCDWFLQPDALAPYRPPADKYCVETKARFSAGTFWSNIGVIFGADEQNKVLYALCLGRGSAPNLGWFLMYKDDYDFPKRGCSGPTFKIEGEDNDDIGKDDWNKLEVGVDGNHVKVWINGRFRGEADMPGLKAMTRLGLIGGTYEALPVDARFDYFTVKPGQDCR